MRTRLTRSMTAMVAALAAGAALAVAGAPAGAADGETIVVAFNSGVATLDPAVACDNEAGSVIINLYDRLLTKGLTAGEAGSLIASSEDIQPQLARSWTVSEDARTFTFKLRDGIKFSTGNLVDAEAVRYSLSRVANMELCGAYALTAGLWGNIESIEAPDAETVIVRLTQADPLFLEALTLFPASILDPTVVENNGGVEKGKTNEYMASHAAGSGPFVLANYDPESEIILEANPNYWGEGPKVERVVLKVVKESSTRDLLLRSGELDVAFRVPVRDLERLNDESLKVLHFPSPEITYIGLNNKEGPLSDANLRRALLYAVPYDQLVQDVLHGYGSQLRGPVPNTMAYFSPDVTYPYVLDLEKARQHLKQANVPGELSIDIRAGFVEHEEIATVLQDTFKDLGIDLKINKLNTANFQDRVWNFKSEMFITDDRPWINDPGYNLGYNLPCGELYNWAQYCNPSVDEWLVEARHATDPGRRAELYKKISQAFIDDAPWIMLFVRDDVVVLNSHARGYIADPSGAHRFSMLHTE